VEIKPGRIISLGYGKYWRSDEIVGLVPIEEDRGPGRRTEVYTSTLDHPIVASRSESAILQEMAIASDDLFHLQEAREVFGDLAETLAELPDLLKRMLANEGGFDVEQWVRWLRASLIVAETASITEQNELFD
jgi:hypothetical protein